MASIAVIGAGITGVTTAYALQQRGYNVTVFDRQKYPAMETSYANGGQLSASNAEVWNNWETIIKGLGWLFSKDAPLLFDLSPSWHKYSWIAEFLLAIRHYKKNTAETVRLALTARQRLFDIASSEGIEFNHERRGILHFYKSEQSFKSARHVNKLLCDAGLKRKTVSADEVAQIEPSLHGNMVGGFYTPDDSTGDIHKYTRQLASICERRGVEFKLGHTIRQLVGRSREVLCRHTHSTSNAFNQDSYDGIVVCAGAASRRFATQLGDRINVYPVKGYSITVPVADDADRSVAPWVSLLDDDAKIVTSRLGQDRYRVAGTAEFSGFNRDIRTCRIDPLVSWVEAHHPKLDTSGCVPWAGLRPMMPDMMPRVRQGKCPRVFYNTGHGHLGWTLSAATSELVSELIVAAIPQSSLRVSNNAALFEPLATVTERTVK